jgi:hypothetical protein
MPICYRDPYTLVSKLKLKSNEVLQLVQSESEATI